MLATDPNIEQHDDLSPIIDRQVGQAIMDSRPELRSGSVEPIIRAIMAEVEAVVAAVTTQKECLSEAGHYRFLQTRNLNSFLMWVDRAAARGEADRCVELRHALECLKRRGGRTGSRSG